MLYASRYDYLIVIIYSQNLHTKHIVRRINLSQNYVSQDTLLLHTCIFDSVGISTYRDSIKTTHIDRITRYAFSKGACYVSGDA